MAENDFFMDLLERAYKKKDKDLESRVAAQFSTFRGRAEGVLQFPPAGSYGESVMQIRPGDPLYNISQGLPRRGEFMPGKALSDFMRSEAEREKFGIPQLSKKLFPTPVYTNQRRRKQQKIENIFDKLKRE